MSTEMQTKVQASPAQNFTPVQTGLLQRKSALCNTPGLVEDSGRDQEKLTLQCSSVDQAGTTTVPPIVHEVLRSPGQPLDPETRVFMEPRFGHDFSKVRVHTDSKASESSRAVNAQAYTVGKNIFFGIGLYSPQTEKGRQLLAHELTHVTQQQQMNANLQRVPMVVDGNMPAEREAQQASAAVAAGRSVRIAMMVPSFHVQRQPKEPPLTNDNAGGCGICFRGDMLAIGDTAHRLIQHEFENMYPIKMLTEFPIELLKKTHIISKGIPDLIMPTPTGIKIGEIKPANKEGYLEGEAKIVIYEKLFEELAKQKKLKRTVERLDVKPPPPLDFHEPSSLTCTQMLVVGPSVRGVYGYLCIPPFSNELRRRCQCEGDKKSPEPIRVRQPQEKDVKEKVKQQKRERQLGPEVLVPVGLAALLGAAVKWAGKKAAGRILAPATVIAAIVLVANGAEASIGLEGDDALEAMFMMAAQKGTPVPDDLKEAIKKDTAIRKILLDSAKSSNVTEAQRRLGEQLTRIIVENREQFTEEEIQELLTVSEKNRDVIPNGEVTVEVLRRSLDAVKGRGSKTGEGKAADVVSTEPSKPGPKVTAPTTSGQEGKTPTKLEAGAGLEGPVRRLVEGLVTTSGKGPKVDKASLKQLHEFVRNVKQPLTDELVNELLKRVGPATKGETIEQIIASVQEAITAIHTSKAEDEETIEHFMAYQGATDDVKWSPKAGTKEDKPFTTLVENEFLKITRSETQVYGLLENEFGKITRGETQVIGLETIFKNDKPFLAVIVGRNSRGKLFIGSGNVTPKKIGGSWILKVPKGIKVIDSSGLYGTTYSISIPAKPGVGEAK